MLVCVWVHTVCTYRLTQTEEALKNVYPRTLFTKKKQKENQRVNRQSALEQYEYVCIKVMGAASIKGTLIEASNTGSAQDRDYSHSTLSL